MSAMKRGLPAWTAAVSCAALSVVEDHPRWVVMWLVASAVFFAAKALTLRNVPAALLESLAYTFCWPGLNPVRFLRTHRDSPDRSLIVAGLSNAVFGCTLIWLVARQFNDHPCIAAWTAMIGLIFSLHFGLFHLITAFWRHMGRDVEPLMRCPIASRTLSEFWGRRWNIAFRDLSHALVFRPASVRWGASTSTWIVFGISGLLHDLVISVPAGADLGGPTAYFLLQALGIHLVRAFKPLNGRMWTFAVLLLPVGLLFHPPFVNRVMIPFFQTIGALP